MDKIREKINNFKHEAETWQEKYEDLRVKYKELEQVNADKDNEIRSLTTKNQQLNDDLEKMDKELGELKHAVENSSILSVNNDGLTKKNEKLEADLEDVTDQLKQTKEKIADLDLKNEQLEKRLVAAEEEKSRLESRIDEISKQYDEAKKELNEISATLENL